MVFSSILFLFYFMPVAFTIYYLSPKRWRNLVLLVLSLIFYSWGEVRYFPIMLASILVDYTASNQISHFEGRKGMRRFWLLVSVVFNLGMLGFFKYAGFFARNINAITGLGVPVLELTLPLGISFYTFQTMSYTIDVWDKFLLGHKPLLWAWPARFSSLIMSVHCGLRLSPWGLPIFPLLWHG